MIEVRLFATLRKGRDKILMLDSKEYATALEIINHLGIERQEVAICLINGFHSKVEDEVKDGDIIAIFPPVGGG